MTHASGPKPGLSCSFCPGLGARPRVLCRAIEAATGRHRQAGGATALPWRWRVLGFRLDRNSSAVRRRAQKAGPLVAPGCPRDGWPVFCLQPATSPPRAICSLPCRDATCTIASVLCGFTVGEFDTLRKSVRTLRGAVAAVRSRRLRPSAMRPSLRKRARQAGTRIRLARISVRRDGAVHSYPVISR